MYLGRQKPTETTSSVLRSTYTGNGSTTTYALPGPVANETSIIATINGVTQQDAAYSTDGSNIIFVAAPSLGDSIEIRTLSAVAMSYAPSAGSVVTGIIADGAVTSGKLASGAAVANIGSRAITTAQVPSGSVIQVVQTVKSDTFSTTSSSLTDITGMSVTITPTSATSKILIQYAIGQIGPGTDEVVGIALLRGSTVIGAGTTAGSRILTSTAAVYVNDRGAPQAFCFLDSPATTSSTTYKLQIYVNGGNTVHINRSSTDIDNTTYARTSSTITVMEIAA
jgi:hypothetical protein